LESNNELASLGRRRTIKLAAAALALGLTPLGYAQSTQATTDTKGQVLAQLLYLLAPNVRFNAAMYQRQVNILLLRMSRDAGLNQILSQGIERLQASDPSFLSLPEDGQRDAMRKQAGTPFWAVMANPAVGVYNNPEVWPMIGYEGPAFEKGGYLFRGVNDIAWLPK
jgi:hypothetical protein